MNVFEAGVVLHLVDKVSSGLGAIAMQFTRTQTAANALQARLTAIHSTFQSGLIVAGAGVALASPLVFATKAAMDLQTAMGRVQIATGASDRQMQMLNDTLTRTANMTGIFSKPKLASFAAEMYSSGIRDIGQINEMLPLFAKAADINKIISKGKIGPEDTLHTLVALAHQFGRYDSKSMTPIAEAAVAMSTALPGGMKTLKGMGSYVNIMGNRALGIDPIELMALQAAVAQTSGGTGTGRGALSGANLINFLQRSMPGVFGAGLLSGKSAFAAATMGLADSSGASTVMRNGKLDLELLQSKIAAFEKLSSYEMAQRAMAHVGMLGKKAGEEIPLLQKALATHGAGVSSAQLLSQLMRYQYGSASTMAMLMGDEKFLQAQRKISEAANGAVKTGGIDAMQERAMKMLEPQLMRLQTNLTTLSSTIGGHMIPVLTVVVTRLGDFVDKLNAFAAANPGLVRAGVGLLAIASGAMILGGSALILKAGFMGLQLIFGPLGKAISMTVVGVSRLPAILGGVIPFLTGLIANFGTLRYSLAYGALGLLRFIPPIAGIMAAISAVILVIKNWDKLMQFVHEHHRFFIHITAQVVRAGDFLNQMFQRMIGMLGAAAGAVANFIANIPGLGQIGAGMKAAVERAMKVDDLTAKRDEQYLRSKGLGGIVDNLKGPKAAQIITKGGAGRAGGGTVDKSTNNFYVQQVAGHDHEACARTMKKQAASMMHKASAASGNSVGRSNFTGGATRP